MQTEQYKNSFRAQSLKTLKYLANKSNRYINDKKTIDSLYKIVQIRKAKTIALYVPLVTEVDVMPLINKLRREKKSVYTPFMEDKSFRLVQYRLPLYKKKFGIKETKNSYKFRKKTIDIMIVPIVGVDATLRRIGFGKGMYDRFFEKNKKDIKFTIFTARKLLMSSTIVTNKNDISADLIVI